MVSILDISSEFKSRQQYQAEKSDGWKIFVMQKTSIDAIRSTQGFKEIRDYWAREVLAGDQRLRTMKSEDIKGVQAEVNLGQRFLDFLDNLLVADISPMEDDII